MNAGNALSKFAQVLTPRSPNCSKRFASKPDYELAYANLGILLADMNDLDGAIAQYKKALTLKPDDVGTRYNLGVSYGQKGRLCFRHPRIPRGQAPRSEAPRRAPESWRRPYASGSRGGYQGIPRAYCIGP